MMNEKQHLNQLYVLIGKYRIFLMKYLGLTRVELLKEFSKRLNVPEAEVHLKTIKTVEQGDKMLSALKDWKQELTGVRRLPYKVNPRDYAKKLLGEFKMKVVEIFNSIDGEGKRAGELTTFIRLYGCNLRCDYCDTKYSYEQENEDKSYKELSITEIIQKCEKYKTKNITLTGGEPLIHLDVDYLLRALSEKGFNVNVETNGSVSIKKYFNFNGTPKDEYENVWFTVDYKCPSSGMENKMLIDNFDVDKYSFKNVVYKFVVGNRQDLEKAADIIKNLIFKIDYDKRCLYHNIVYLSPVFGEIEPKEIVEFLQDNDLYNEYTPVRVQLQLHKFIWPVDQRGV